MVQLAHSVERDHNVSRKRDTQGQRGADRHRMWRSEELTVHLSYRNSSALEEPVSPSIGHPLRGRLGDVQLDSEGQRIGITALNGLDAKDRLSLDRDQPQHAMRDAGRFGAGQLAHTMTLTGRCRQGPLDEASPTGSPVPPFDSNLSRKSGWI